jgi:hypothetical protein
MLIFNKICLSFVTGKRYKMRPPKKINVLDKNDGFTAVTTKYGNTLWRSKFVLKDSTIGVLQSYDEKSFYQLNDDATQAVYKVKGYRYPILVWFDNLDGHRIA